jgi:uncharacterized membrane protein YcaP (DUF421 family)
MNPTLEQNGGLVVILKKRNHDPEKENKGNKKCRGTDLLYRQFYLLFLPYPFILRYYT